MLGNGFDVSGTLATITSTKFVTIRENRISVGEASNIGLDRVSISRVGTAVAVKDGSSATAVNLSIDDAKSYIFAVYKKKPEYGAATLKVENATWLNSSGKNVCQKGNFLSINDSAVICEEYNFADEYKTGVMKK